MSNRIKKLGAHFDLRVEASSKPLFANSYGILDDENQLNLMYDHLVEEIEKYIDISKVSSMLEVGCGTGEILTRLASKVPAVMGLDISKKMVDEACAKDLNVVLYDGGSFPIDSNSFDMVLIYSVFINIQYPVAKNLIIEAKRVLRPGGSVLIGMLPHPDRAPFAVHNEISFMLLKNKIRESLGEITYYAYRYDFFLKMYDELGLSEVSFFPCSQKKFDHSSKYNVLFKV